MKKKILFGVIIFIILITTIFNTVLADENSDIMPISDELPEDAVMIDEDEIVKELYFNAKEISEENFYGFKEKITMESDIINGNTFLCAETVNLKDITINGDIFIAANNLNVSSDAVLNGNVFIFAANVDFDGNVAREIYAFVKDIVFEENTKIMYNANIVADHISIKGTFYRDINATVDNFEVKENGVILGNLNYISEKEVIVADSAVITNINFSKYVEEEKKLIDIVEEKVFDFARYFILVMVVFIVILKYLPNLIEKAKKNLSVSSFGLGIATLILVPIILVILLLFRVFTSLVFAILALFILVLMISNAITNIAIAKAISDKKQDLKLPILVALVTVINWILYQIPLAGGILAFIWITTGLGISVKNAFTK